MKKFLKIDYARVNTLIVIHCLRIDLVRLKIFFLYIREKKYSFHKSRKEICFHFTEAIHEVSKLDIDMTIWKTIEERNLERCRENVATEED